MDRVRYFAALLLWVTLPPGVLFWFFIHPFARFWRRTGTWLTYTVTFLLMGLVMVGLVLVRRQALAVEYGTNWLFVAVAALLAVASGWIQAHRRRHLTTRILVGLPELAPARHPTPLLTQGIYGRIRHPRYVEVMIMVVAWALFTNYLAAYCVAAGSILAILLLVPLEEAELVERYGEDYVEYSRRVPRYLPRLRRRAADDTDPAR